MTSTIPEINVCLVTAPSQDVASSLAKLLVEKRLAACVNIIPHLRSVYLWEDAINIDDEVLMIIKTTADRISQLQETLLAEHPYKTPEFIAIPSGHVSQEYAAWVQNCVA